MTDIELVFFVGVAMFFAYKLWSVLGKTNGQEQARTAEMAAAAEKQRTAANAQPKILDIKPEKIISQEAIPTTLEEGVKKLKLADKNFTLAEFKKTAEDVFEQVLKAFSAKKTDELKALLSPEIFKLFEQEVAALEVQESSRQATLLAMREPEILSVDFAGNNAQIAAKFSSEQVILVKNKAGEIIEGAANQADHITEIWTFEREVSGKKSGWLVAGIQSE